MSVISVICYLFVFIPLLWSRAVSKAVPRQSYDSVRIGVRILARTLSAMRVVRLYFRGLKALTFKGRLKLTPLLWNELYLSKKKIYIFKRLAPTLVNFKEEALNVSQMAHSTDENHKPAVSFTISPPQPNSVLNRKDLVYVSYNLLPFFAIMANMRETSDNTFAYFVKHTQNHHFYRVVICTLNM